jgi:hypothetical protein
MPTLRSFSEVGSFLRRIVTPAKAGAGIQIFKKKRTAPEVLDFGGFYCASPERFEDNLSG